MTIEQTLAAAREAVERKDLLDSSFGHLSTWLSSDNYKEFHKEIISLVEAGSWQALNDAFYEQIAFGTGGMRGTMGLGSARINDRTIGTATEALAQYLETFGDDAKKRGVVVCHEVRHSSSDYARVISEVLMAHGITVHLFPEFRSTPELSFSVRHLGAYAGIMISASHNPSTDNGYKVYWNMGEQVVEPHASGIMDRVPSVETIERFSFEEGEEKGLLVMVSSDVDQAYVDAALKHSLPPVSSDLSIVYTPFHGAGQTSTLKVLRAAGYEISCVEAQMVPDGSFSTVNGGRPNPEDLMTFDLAIAQAKEEGADLILSNDPDADRVGVAARNNNGEYVLLSGNQVGVLIMDHLLSERQKMNDLQKEDVVVKTMVSTDMVYDIAKAFNVDCVGDLLVGFKYIAGVMQELKEPARFLMGMEESLGYLVGNYAYDKDGAAGALLLVRLMSELKAKGVTLLEHLDGLYEKYGYYKETLESTYFEGASGKATMDHMMNELRNNPPSVLGEDTVYRVIDRSGGVAFNPAEPSITTEVEGEKGNVLVFELSENGRTKATIRPSGTEPKVKYYIAVNGDVSDRESLDAHAISIGEALKKLAESYS